MEAWSTQSKELQKKFQEMSCNQLQRAGRHGRGLTKKVETRNFAIQVDEKKVSYIIIQVFLMSRILISIQMMDGKLNE